MCNVIVAEQQKKFLKKSTVGGGGKEGKPVLSHTRRNVTYHGINLGGK